MKYDEINFIKRDEIPAGWYLNDYYSQALNELAIVRNPNLRLEKTNLLAVRLNEIIKKFKVKDLYVAYPWLKTVVRLPEEKVFFELRTARNKEVISKREQEKYRQSKVCLLGLSIGTCVLNSILISGGPKHIKVADFDTIEITNLNRLNAEVTYLGMKKSLYAKHLAYGIDPFTKIVVQERKVTERDLEKFIMQDWVPDVLVDEIDDLKLKLAARKLCKKYRIPVVMVTNNGDYSILDVERYDENKNQKLFGGRADIKKINSLDSIDFKEWIDLAIQIVGKKIIDARVMRSINNIGVSVAGVPQLGSTTFISGALASLAIRKIATNQTLKSGRYVAGFSEARHDAD